MAKKADLQAQLNELDVKFQENDTNEQLELMIEAVGSRAIIERLTEEKLQLAESNAALIAANREIQEQLEKTEAEAENEGKTLVKHGGSTFEVLSGCSFGLGDNYSKEEIAENRNGVVAKLVKMQSGILQIVE